MKLIIALVLFTVCACIYAEPYTNCSSPSAHFHIDTISITPDPPKKGQHLQVTASGRLDKTITAGNVNIQIKYLGVVVVNENEDICKIAPKPGCPIAAGAYKQSAGADIPGSVPGGRYTGSIKITDQDKQEVACINLDFRL